MIKVPEHVLSNHCEKLLIQKPDLKAGIVGLIQNPPKISL